MKNCPKELPVLADRKPRGRRDRPGYIYTHAGIVFLNSLLVTSGHTSHLRNMMKYILAVLAVAACSSARPQFPEIKAYNPISVSQPSISARPLAPRGPSPVPRPVPIPQPLAPVPAPAPAPAPAPVRTITTAQVRDRPENYRWAIVRQANDAAFDGSSYQWSYETENQIIAEETGTLINPKSQDEAMTVRGSYSFVAPDGIQYTVVYTAGPEGFAPQGAHLHPIPEAILRSIEYNKAHPEEDESQNYRRQ